MPIASEQVGDVVVLQPEERLDVSSGPVLKGVVEQLFERRGPRKVLIDLARVDYVSSIGLSACLRSAQLAETHGGHVVVAGLQPAVREVFDLTGFDKVLDLQPSRAAALALFGLLEPRAATGRVEPQTGLTLPEEILLLTLADEGGRFIELPEHALDFALAGAVLMDLLRRNRVDSDLQTLRVVDPTPVGEALLDPALHAILHARQPMSAERWIRTLAQEGAELRERAIARLIGRGILDRKDNVLHWMLGGRRYPVLHDTEQREVKTRVLGILASGEVPAPQDVALIALADACAVFDAVLGLDEMLDVRPRIAEVARMDLVAQAMASSLRDMQSHGAWDGPPTGIYGHVSDALH